MGNRCLPFTSLVLLMLAGCANPATVNMVQHEWTQNKLCALTLPHAPNNHADCRQSGSDKSRVSANKNVKKAGHKIAVSDINTQGNANIAPSEFINAMPFRLAAAPLFNAFNTQRVPDLTTAKVHVGQYSVSNLSAAIINNNTPTDFPIDAEDFAAIN